MFSQLLRKARQRGFIIPVIKPKGGGPGGPGGDGVGYEGATVLEPKIGGRAARGSCQGAAQPEAGRMHARGMEPGPWAP